MSLPSTIQSFQTIIPVNVTSIRKTFTLPAAATNPGRMLIIKDQFGYSQNSSIAVSTTGTDILERSTTRGIFLNENFGAWTFTNDGISRWFLIDAFENTLFRALPLTLSATFTYTGADQSFVVPANVSRLAVYVWGAGGGGNAAGAGGAGAMVQGVLSVTPGSTLTIIVGQGGTIGTGNPYGGGGAGLDAGNGTSARGGGRSAIRSGATELVTAGGGGGCGFNSGRGGAATFQGIANPGNNGSVAPIGNGGGGGRQVSGGAGGTGSTGTGGTGSQFQGGNGAIAGAVGGGGGGGGFFGGGGGGGGGSFGGSSDSGPGGGGGSSFINNLSLIPGEQTFGFNSTNGILAPNSASPFYGGGAAVGGASGNGAGGNGRVVLRY